MFVSASVATINKELRHLKAVFNVARKSEILSKVPEIDMLKEPSRIPRFVPDEKLAQLIVACKVHSSDGDTANQLQEATFESVSYEDELMDRKLIKSTHLRSVAKAQNRIEKAATKVFDKQLAKSCRHAVGIGIASRGRDIHTIG